MSYLYLSDFVIFVVGALNYQLVVCWGPAVKSRGRGGCFVVNNLDIDFTSGYFTHLLNLACLRVLC